MFCKWCGKTIRITDVNCPNCGRETPPLSDCGGFYNLKAPDAEFLDGRNSTSPIVVPQSGETTSRDIVNCPVVEKLESKYIRDRKADKAHHKMTVVFFGIVAVLIALSFALGVLAVAQIGEVTEKVSQMQNNMDAIEELLKETQQTTEIIPEPSIIEIPEETTTKATELVSETGAVTVEEETNELGEAVFKVQYQNGIEMFADGKITYLWQYSKETDVWQNVDEDLFQLNEDGIAVLVCTETFLEGIDAQEHKIELRCVIQCENESGDTMEICIRGMVVGEETLDIAIDETTKPETTETNNSEQ